MKIQKIIVMILSLVFAPALYLGALSGIIFIYFYDRKEFNKMYNESVRIWVSLIFPSMLKSARDVAVSSWSIVSAHESQAKQVKELPDIPRVCEG